VVGDSAGSKDRRRMEAWEATCEQLYGEKLLVGSCGVNVWDRDH
jgi:hypothetical protein